MSQEQVGAQTSCLARIAIASASASCSRAHRIFSTRSARSCRTGTKCTHLHRTVPVRPQGTRSEHTLPILEPHRPLRSIMSMTFRTVVREGRDQREVAHGWTSRLQNSYTGVSCTKMREPVRKSPRSLLHEYSPAPHLPYLLSGVESRYSPIVRHA
jgi:hypothetical protein